MDNNRIIGVHDDGEQGALLLVTTGLHGNEPAGEKAVNTVLRLLQEEKIKNKDFVFYGQFVGLVGNITAKAKKKRYIDTDMNRIWDFERVKYIDTTPDDRLLSEEREAKALLHTIRDLIAKYQPARIFLLDLHTTTAEGGIFTIVPRAEESERIGATLYAPVVTGFDALLQGTLMTYFNGSFEGLPTVTLTFESGQHDDEESVTNAVSAIINMMRAVGSVKPEDVEDKHDLRLRERAALLPRKAELLYRHIVRAGDGFKMRPNYLNFQAVKAKEILATDRKGDIKAAENALILMPLYQKQGNDGFFLVKEVK